MVAFLQFFWYTVGEIIERRRPAAALSVIITQILGDGHENKALFLSFFSGPSCKAARKMQFCPQ